MAFTTKAGQRPGVTAPAEAPAPVRFARQELERYLERMLGASKTDPARRVALSVDPDTPGGDEAFAIRVTGDRAEIKGGGPAGVLYGAYAFLREHGGCQFSGLPPDGEYVPSLSRLDVPEGERARRPALWYRGMQLTRNEGADLMIRRADWMAKNGMNYVMFRPLPDTLTVASGYAVDPATGELRVRAKGAQYTNAWFRKHLVPEVLKRGLKLDMNHHNLLSWLPPERYFDEHPEWFALRDGERRRDPWQLCICTGNADAVAELSANVRRYLAENPEVGIVGVVPEDGYGMCQCDACRAMDEDPEAALRRHPLRDPGHWDDFKRPEGENRSLSARYARLVNAVARDVRRDFPNVHVGYGAYVDLQWPARHVRLEDNVVPWVAMYWRCGAHPLGERSCALNRFFFDVLKQWQQAHTGKFILYEYYMGMGAQRGLPYPQAPLICREWPELKHAGVQGATLQSAGESHEAYGLNYLAFARSGWEEEVQYPALRDAYLQGMFGAAAPALRPVYERFDEIVRHIAEGRFKDSPFLHYRPTQRGCLQPNGRNVGLFLEQAGVQEIERCIRDARGRASNDREQRQVEAFAAAVEYWQRAAAAFAAEAQAQAAAEAGREQAAAQRYAEAFVAVKAVHDMPAASETEGWVPRAREVHASRVLSRADPGVLAEHGWLSVQVALHAPTEVQATADGKEEPNARLDVPGTERVVIRAAREQVRVRVADGRGVGVRVNGAPVDVPSGAFEIEVRWRDRDRGEPAWTVQPKARR